MSYGQISPATRRAFREISSGWDGLVVRTIADIWTDVRRLSGWTPPTPQLERVAYIRDDYESDELYRALTREDDRYLGRSL